MVNLWCLINKTHTYETKTTKTVINAFGSGIDYGLVSEKL